MRAAGSVGRDDVMYVMTSYCRRRRRVGIQSRASPELHVVGVDTAGFWNAVPAGRTGYGPEQSCGRQAADMVDHGRLPNGVDRTCTALVEHTDHETQQLTSSDIRSDVTHHIKLCSQTHLCNKAAMFSYDLKVIFSIFLL